MSGLVAGRPGRRVCVPSYFLATSLRYQRKMVSGCSDARDRCAVTTAEDLAFHGKMASLVVGQAQSPGTVHRSEDAVLLEQVVNHRLLMSIDPAREQQEEKRERGR